MEKNHLVLSLLVLATISSGCVSSQEAQADKLQYTSPPDYWVDRYFDAMYNQDFGAHAFLSEDVKSNITPSEFSRKYERIFNQYEYYAVRFQTGEPAIYRNNRTAHVPFKLVRGWDSTQKVVRDNITGSARLTLEDKVWRIDEEINPLLLSDKYDKQRMARPRSEGKFSSPGRQPSPLSPPALNN